MRFIMAIVFLFVLSSASLRHVPTAHAQDFSYSQPQKATKHESRRYKKRYRRSYRRPRIVVRPRAVVQPVRTKFESPKVAVNTFDWFHQKPKDIYPWDWPVQAWQCPIGYLCVKPLKIYAENEATPFEEKQVEVELWKKRFFYSIWGTFVLVFLFFIYAVVGFVTAGVKVTPVDTKD